MKDFEFFAPKTLEEAKGLLHQYKDVPPAIIAGGTDLVIEINDRWEKPDVVIDIKKLKELEYIRVEENT
ncbi:MAG: FAD binding domain-containing protein, partial [Eubacterium sp.]